MKRKFGTILLLQLIIFLFPLPSRADVKIISGTFDRGVKECKAGNFAKGIDTIIDAAMDLRREAPAHKLNNQWRAKLRFCFGKWSATEEKSCKKQHRVEAYHHLLAIQKKASLIASGGTKKQLVSTTNSCFYSLKNHYGKVCRTNEEAIGSLSKLLEYVAPVPKFQGQIRTILGKCLKTQWSKTLTSCRAQFSMGMLKRVFLMRKLMPKTKVVVQDYESCLEAQMIGARNMCRAMQFSKGRRLFKKAHYLLKYSRPVNTSLLQKASSQRGECGLFTLDFSVKMRAVSGGVPYILPASSQLTVVNTPDRKGIKACGVLSFKRTAVKRGVCTAQATVPETRPHYICLKGTITRQAGKKYPIARLSFDGTMARTLVRESVQYICPKKAPVVFNERLFEQLLVPKHMHLAIPVVGSEKKMFRLSLDPGGARKSVFQGSYTLHFL